MKRVARSAARVPLRAVSQLPKRDRNIMLLQVLVVSGFGAVVGCVIGYYLLF